MKVIQIWYEKGYIMRIADVPSAADILKCGTLNTMSSIGDEREDVEELLERVQYEIQHRLKDE